MIVVLIIVLYAVLGLIAARIGFEWETAKQLREPHNQRAGRTTYAELPSFNQEDVKFTAFMTGACWPIAAAGYGCYKLYRALTPAGHAIWKLTGHVTNAQAPKARRPKWLRFR